MGLRKNSRARLAGLAGCVLAIAAGCSASNDVALAKGPIEIGLDMKIDEAVRVKLVQEIAAFIERNPDIF